MREGLALAEVAWFDWPTAAHRHLILDGLVVLLRAFQRALQGPGGSVLGLADTRHGRSPGPAGFPGGRSAIAGCRARAVIVAAGPRLDAGVPNEGPWLVPAGVPSPQPASSLLAAERRLVLLSDRIACLRLDECCGLGERGAAGRGCDVAVEPATRE